MTILAACNVMLQIFDGELLLFNDILDYITNGNNTGELAVIYDR